VFVAPGREPPPAVTENVPLRMSGRLRHALQRTRGQATCVQQRGAAATADVPGRRRCLGTGISHPVAARSRFAAFLGLTA
jgi:hypothetical protein